MDPIHAYQRHLAILGDETGARHAAAAEMTARTGRPYAAGRVATRHPTAAELIDRPGARFTIACHWARPLGSNESKSFCPAAYLRHGYVHMEHDELDSTHLAGEPVTIWCGPELIDRTEWARRVDGWIASVEAWAARVGACEVRVSDALCAHLTADQHDRLMAAAREPASAAL